MSKNYDQIFKSLAEDDPRGMLYLFGGIPLSEPCEVESLDREIGLPALSVDHVYRVRQPGQPDRLAHFEIQTRYKADVPERVAWYMTSLALKFRIPVDSTLVLLVERHAPREVPGQCRIRLGSLEVVANYRVERLWEMDPDAVVDAGRAHLLPFVTLMRSNESALERVFLNLTRRGEQKLLTQCVILGGLRYDRDGLGAMLGRKGNMLLTREMIEESSFYQMILEKGTEVGRVEGRVEGLEVGLVEGTRRAVRLVAGLRFPALGNLPELDTITQTAPLEELLKQLVLTPDEDAARLAVALALTRS